MPTLMSLFFVLVTLVSAAGAQGIDEAKKCAEEQQNVDLKLQYCSRALQSGQLSKQNLAMTFLNRGNAYSTKGDYDRAIQDFDQAIRLNPNYVPAFFNRGNAYQ